MLLQYLWSRLSYSIIFCGKGNTKETPTTARIWATAGLAATVRTSVVTGSPVYNITAAASATDRILTTTRMPETGDLGGLQQLQQQQQTGY
jgi:hypothetical protein